MIEGDLPPLHAFRFEAGLPRPIADAPVISLTVDEIQIERRIAGLQLADPVQAGRAVAGSEQRQTRCRR
ncbi:hypothetical protein D3C86_2067550 [compost metagenome]